jgi:hypothetical protein
MREQMIDRASEMNLDKHKAPHLLFNLSRFVTAAINEENKQMTTTQTQGREATMSESK